MFMKITQQSLENTQPLKKKHSVWPHHSQFEIYISDTAVCRPSSHIQGRNGLGHKLSKESMDVVEVVDQEEDGEADGKAEDDGEHDQDFSHTFPEIPSQGDFFLGGALSAITPFESYNVFYVTNTPDSC